MEEILGNAYLLEGIKIAVFISAFLFSTSFLLPKGTIYLIAGLHKKEHGKLASGITFVVGAIFILVYLLSSMIVTHAKILLGHPV